MSGRPAAIAHDEHLATLGAVHERLPDVAVDDQLAPLGDLSHLVLGVAVDVHLQAVHPAGGVVTVGAVQVDAHPVGSRAQAHSVEALAAQAIDDETLPPRAIGSAHQDGVAIVTLGREALGVDAQQFLPGLGRRQEMAGGPVDAAPEASGGPAEERRHIEELVEGLLHHLDDRRPRLVPHRKTPVVNAGE